jgi:hypothetical protein
VVYHVTNVAAPTLGSQTISSICIFTHIFSDNSRCRIL